MTELHTKEFEKSSFYKTGDDVYLRLFCPHCNMKLKAIDEIFGQTQQCPSCHNEFIVPNPALHCGQRVKRFQVDGLVGMGSNGQVFAAHDVDDEETDMVLKIATSDMISDQLIKFFKQEFTRLKKLDHPSIVNTYGCGHNDSYYYFAMSRVNGETFAKIQQRQETLEEKMVAHVIIQVAEAMDYAWNLNKTIHGDLKPDNLMLDEKGQVYVMDWGYSQVLQEGDEQDLVDEVNGTPLFLPPELVKGNRISGPQEDIYSLGVTCYIMLTGEYPFLGESIEELFENIRKAPIETVREQNSEVSRQMEQVISKMMSRDKAERYQDWKEILIDMIPFLNRYNFYTEQEAQ